MVISKSLKERFVKDFNIPIRLYDEPYFTERLKLYDPYYGTIAKWESFVNELSSYSNQEKYFAAYNKTKDEAINQIKRSDTYADFIAMDLNFSHVDKSILNISKKDIFKQSNIGRTFIGLDIKKANFSSLKYYDSTVYIKENMLTMFNGANTYEEFISQFTDNKNIINSKYIREVIFGNCNAPRQITYEKHMMVSLMSAIVSLGGDISNAVFLSNDEVIFDVTNIINVVTDQRSQVKILDFDSYSNLLNVINKAVDMSPVPYRMETYTIKGVKIDGEIAGYLKYVVETGETMFKCLNSINIPWVIRHLNNEPITESDLTFINEKRLAKYIDIPKIEIVE